MKLFTPEISWHERDPIYTCAFHPLKKNKFVTAGVTGVIRLWEIKEANKESNNCSKNPLSNVGIEIDFIANLKRHTKSVNVVRWNHDGLLLASAGDEAVIFVWNENEIKNQKTLDNDEDENKENWYSFKTFRGHLEDILDLSWSSDGSILISGSVDNSVIVWNVASGAKLAILKEPKGFVQGVVYDPLNATYAVLSTDRCLRVFSSTNNKCIHNANKIQLNKENSADQQTPNIRIFHDDTMKSFFRRMSFSPDGLLLFTPSGCLEIDEKLINTSYIFTRNNYSRPCFYMLHDRPSVAISVCPLKFELNKIEKTDENKNENLFNFPYRYIFAVATEDSVFLYDTQLLMPFAYATGIHYSNLSDLSWSHDGRLLIISSIDGFCTFLIFKENELGVVYHESLALGSTSLSQISENMDDLGVQVINESNNDSDEKTQGKNKKSIIKSMFNKKEKSNQEKNTKECEEVEMTVDIIEYDAKNEAEAKNEKPAATTTKTTASNTTNPIPIVNSKSNAKRIKLIPIS